jgi:hypothetical protein
VDYEAEDRYHSIHVASCIVKGTRFYLNNDHYATDVLDNARRFPSSWDAATAIDGERGAWSRAFRWKPVPLFVAEQAGRASAIRRRAGREGVMTCAACGHPVPTYRGPGLERLCRWCYAMWAWIAFRPTGPRVPRPLRHPCGVCGRAGRRGVDCDPCRTWAGWETAIARYVRAGRPA